jgi:hypothetical protein
MLPTQSPGQKSKQKVGQAKVGACWAIFTYLGRVHHAPSYFYFTQGVATLIYRIYACTHSFMGRSKLFHSFSRQLMPLPNPMGRRVARLGYLHLSLGHER